MRFDALVEEHGGGEVRTVHIVSARGCAYVLMADRADAAKILDNLKYAKLHGTNLKIDWAPGVGVKDKKYKDYWDVDRGVSYIPWDSFPTNPVKLEQLEEGSVFDIDSLPEDLKKLRQVQPTEETPSEPDVDQVQENAIPILPVMGTSLPPLPHPSLSAPIPSPMVSTASEVGPEVPPPPQLLHAGLPPPRMPPAAPQVMRMPIMPSGVLSPFMGMPPVGVRLPAGFVPGQPIGGGIPNQEECLLGPDCPPSLTALQVHRVAWKPHW
ncbi:putative splicing factor, arginine/serine-rich 15 [Apostichopus japonicus]|uniref:Putative splicing factor, arginine/serine-rich 15 n=1 Tax=Stichopus japonicus TaxID=307972 RepID=A0A2G8LDY7_STIJA|nr:putative splicing factor, arginine/serine-rich 15 [Apostichopus japonicus]